jgi:DNA-binding MarR family transcriptional regulator
MDQNNMTPDNANHLINLFFMTTRSLHKHIQKAEVGRTFSFLQFIAMRVVGEEKSANMKDVARILSITPASATSLINGLVKLGALERTADSMDRRVIRLSITPSGKKALSAAENTAKKELKGVFLQLSEKDRNNMITVLEKLSAILSKNKSTEPVRRESVNGRKR